MWRCLCIFLFRQAQALQIAFEEDMSLLRCISNLPCLLPNQLKALERLILLLPHSPWSVMVCVALLRSEKILFTFDIRVQPKIGSYSISNVAGCVFFEHGPQLDKLISTTG
ncbi:uncharacterized protein DS421_9g273830 [Arachis hypogaea]|nr:uncharacterized protein DS421_9g273830 [Arachis hypogaea]